MWWAARASDGRREKARERRERMCESVWMWCVTLLGRRAGSISCLGSAVPVCISAYYMCACRYACMCECVCVPVSKAGVYSSVLCIAVKARPSGRTTRGSDPKRKGVKRPFSVSRCSKRLKQAGEWRGGRPTNTRSESAGASLAADH